MDIDHHSSINWSEQAWSNASATTLIDVSCVSG
jgi:hypothetical protein